MTPAELAASWRAKADDMDNSAKAYNRACVKHKGVQLIMVARSLRACADELDNVNAGDSNAQP